MLSRPADLSILVALSHSKPQEFFEDDSLHVLVSKLLNCQDERVSDKDTKLDVLAILANLSGSGTICAKEEVRTALQGVSEWFDDYLGGEQGDGLEQEPELHKSMLLLLARAWNYKLKTEDLLELTRGDRGLALDSVVGVVEDGMTYATELVQSRKPSEGYMAQWEHELVCRQHEKPLVLQLCRLVRGFTHPASYFAAKRYVRRKDSAGGRGREASSAESLALFSVEEFSVEMDSLLEITLRSRVIEKLSVALHACLFARHDRQEQPETTTLDMHVLEEHSRGREPYAYGAIKDEDDCNEFRAPLEDSDHLAIHCVHMFTQNLYHYATRNTDFFRQHMLSDTLLVPQLVLPYLDQCVRQAQLLCSQGAPSLASYPQQGWVDEGRGCRLDRTPRETYAKEQEREQEQEQLRTKQMEAALAQGIASSLRTLIIASFRAPPNKYVLGLMQRLNPTGSLLRARPFIARHDYIFALLCLLNVNMGALNMGSTLLEEEGMGGQSNGREHRGEHSLKMALAQGLLDELASVFKEMTKESKRRVVRRVTHSGALPLSRDAPGYNAVLGMLGVTGSWRGDDDDDSTLGWNNDAEDAEGKCVQDQEDWTSDRKAAKSESEKRAWKLSRATEQRISPMETSSGGIRDGEGPLAAEAKGEGATEWNGRDEGRKKERKLKLLGDLPRLDKKTDPSALADLKKQRVEVNLDLPSSAKSLSSRLNACGNGGGSAPDGGRPVTLGTGKSSGVGHARVHEVLPTTNTIINGKADSTTARSHWKADDIEDGRSVGDVPKGFLCAINGHMMKQPTRSPYGHVYELSTILLWLESRGRVCPFTGNALNKEDLVPDDELRTRVMRWHIQKTTIKTGLDFLEGDDIYDF